MDTIILEKWIPFFPPPIFTSYLKKRLMKKSKYYRPSRAGCNLSFALKKEEDVICFESYDYL